MSKPPAPKKTRVRHQTVDLYQNVIDDTISRVKGEFVQEGIAEDILDELRAIWERKLTETGVCDPDPEEEEEEPEEAPSAATQSPIVKQEPAPLVSQGLAPSTAMRPNPAAVPAAAKPPPQAPQVLQPPPPQPNYMYNPHQLNAMQQMNAMSMPQYGMQPGTWPVFNGAQMHPAQLQHLQQQMLAQANAQAHASPAQALYMGHLPPAPPGYGMPHPPPVATAPPPNPAAALPSLAGQKRSLEDSGVAAAGNPAAKQLNTGAVYVNNPTIPQQDGPADDGAAPSAAAGEDDEDAIGPGDSADELNEGDDLADVDDHEEIDEEEIKDVVLGQFEKVHRSKAKWKVNLKNCVATINGVDYLLKKVTGEMNF